MTKMKNQLHVAVIALCIATACNAPTETAETTEATLGSIEFTPTGMSEAQPHFNKGLLLMHSFEYKDAEKSFQKAIKIDPDFYMAYWGEAMTHNHPLWSARYQEEGEKALANLAETSEERLALAPNEMEHDFMQGVEILFGEGEKVDNDMAYSKHMKKMVAK